MDLRDAVHAAEFLQPRTVVPMHYDTFEMIRADPHDFKAQVETKTSARCVILKPGEEYQVPERL